jgi:hypothetical protein
VAKLSTDLVNKSSVKKKNMLVANNKGKLLKKAHWKNNICLQKMVI